MGIFNDAGVMAGAVPRPAVVAPVPATMSPEMRMIRQGMAPTTAPVARTAPTVSVTPKVSTMAPIAAAQAAYQETSNPFDAFLQGWTNAGSVREAQTEEQAKMDQVASALEKHQDLAQFVRSGVMGPADAVRIAGDRDASTSKASADKARKDQISAYLTELAGADEKYAQIAKQWAAGVLDEDGVATAVQKIDEPTKAPPPTDDMKELEFINAERVASGKPKLSMEDFLASKRGQGLSIETNPDGSVRVTQGGKLTEGQSKDIGFYTRGLQANQGLAALEGQLTDFGMSQADLIPLGIGNYLKTPEFRQAKVEANNFLSSILRKDSGAAITDKEFDLYGPMFLPIPGDDAGTISLKRQKRATALMAIRSGLGTAEAVAAANEANLSLDTPTEEAQGVDVPAADAEPATPTTDEEYNALPSGTLFVDPDDGKTYRKP